MEKNLKQPLKTTSQTKTYLKEPEFFNKIKNIKGLIKPLFVLSSILLSWRQDYEEKFAQVEKT